MKRTQFINSIEPIKKGINQCTTAVMHACIISINFFALSAGRQIAFSNLQKLI